MSESTANKLVAFFLVGGIAYALIRSKSAGTTTTYHRIWGTTLLSLGGAALAGFAPQIVGPYFLLVIIAYVASHFTGLGNAVGTLKSSAGVNKT